MVNVKEVLNRKKLPEGYPPTMLDVKTREKHVPESVQYNMKHFREHVQNVMKQLDKLDQTDPALAKKEAREALATVEKCAKQLKEYCNAKVS